MDFNSLLWALPFAGIILSMSFMPLMCPQFWEKYSGYIPLGWTIIYLTAAYFLFSPSHAFNAICHPLLSDYVSFIVQIATLYIVAGGIYINFPNGKGPIFNTIFLAFGSLLGLEQLEPRCF